MDSSLKDSSAEYSGEMHGMECEECKTRHGEKPPGKSAPAILSKNGVGKKRARLLCQFCASDLVRRLQEHPHKPAAAARRRAHAASLAGAGVKELDLFTPARAPRAKKPAKKSARKAA